MKSPLARLAEKTANLGNYNHKYLHIISTNIDRLTSALEREGVHDRVHLWGYSTEIDDEMNTVSVVSSDRQEALDFLGCYYALQFLHMNLRMIDKVKLELPSSEHRDLTSRKLMLEAGLMFRQLTRSYMQQLLNIFLKDSSYPEFVMLGVGTRSDQDDIDIGIVHKGAEDSANLNRAMGQLSSQMFKTATRLHFHLSEHVGDNSMTATIKEYEDVLDNNAYDFIIVNEMIGAATILGSIPLHREFREKVTDRFYYDPDNKMNRFHEGFLRGILGEIRSVLSRPVSKRSINPKEEGLRPIRGLLAALKLVHRIDQVNAWFILDELRERDPWRTEQYNDLDKALSFFELFRHLYQILVTQDEDIDLSEPPIEKMVARIAEMIGFENQGVVSAKDFLLVRYYRFLDKSINAIDILTGDLRLHLKEVSVLRPIFSGEDRLKSGEEGNLAMDFIRSSFFSEGITYWEDFLEELGDTEKPFYDEFVESFLVMPEKIRRRVGSLYIAGARQDPAPVLKFLSILAWRADNDESWKLFRFLSSIFISELAEISNSPDLLSVMSVSHPVLLNNFLSNLWWEDLDRFMTVVARKPALIENIPYHKQLVALAHVHSQSSHFFRRHFHPLLSKYPIFIKNLYRNDRLKEISSGLYSDLTSLEPLDVLYEKIGDYYDMEFVRVSLLALEGVSSEITDAEFIEFSDRYTHSLFEFAMQEVHKSYGHPVHTHDLLALYAAGGHAREQGFDDDYDMFFILDSSDEETKELCNKIVAKMNYHILKRGILPHHRLAAHFGSYVVSLDQLAEHLSGATEDVFVDLSQILGARILVGSSKLDRKLRERVVEPLIFERRDRFIEYIIEETVQRHTDVDEESKNNIKECPGGQRDIEMLLLVYKARHGMRDPLSRKMLKNLIEIVPDSRDDFNEILEHMDFIRKLRDIYRLKVAAHDGIDVDSLGAVAESFGMENDQRSARILHQRFLERSAEVSSTIMRLMKKV